MIKTPVLPEIMLACLKVAWINIFIDGQFFTIILTYSSYINIYEISF